MKRSILDFLSPELRTDRDAVRKRLIDELKPVRQRALEFCSMAGHSSDVHAAIEVFFDRIDATALAQNQISIQVMHDPAQRQPTDHAVAVMRALDACFQHLELKVLVEWGYDGRDRPVGDIYIRAAI